jgi:hypothetical protein
MKEQTCQKFKKCGNPSGETLKRELTRGGTYQTKNEFR